MAARMRKPRADRPHLNPTLGPYVCDWIEAFLVHGPGDIQGQPITLDDEFRAFIWRCYEVYPAAHPRAGRRVHRRAFLSRPKGRAKSELAGMIACAEGLAEVRFDGWDAKGNAVGRPPTSALVRCFATEEDQAGNTYDNVYYMLREGPVADEYALDVGMGRTLLPDGGQIFATTSAASSKDGGKDTFNVFDETHLWTTTNLKKLHETVVRNLMKRSIADGWALETSTMYAPGEQSVAEETHQSARVMPSVLFDHKQAPLEVDIEDDAALLAVLRDLYGPAAEWMDLVGLIAEQFRNPSIRESDKRRYWLNQPWHTERKFCTPAQWDARADTTRTIPDRSRVVLAFDGARTNDTTALLVVSIDVIPHLDVVDTWERPENAPSGWEVNPLDVEETIRKAAKRWKVEEVAADVYGWSRSLKILEEEGLPAVGFPQNMARMAPATKSLYDALTTGDNADPTTWGMTHSGDPRLRAHVLAASTEKDSRGERIVKPILTRGTPSRSDQAAKVDLAICAVMGHDRAKAMPLKKGPPRYIDLNEVYREMQEAGET